MAHSLAEMKDLVNIDGIYKRMQEECPVWLPICLCQYPSLPSLRPPCLPLLTMPLRLRVWSAVSQGQFHRPWQLSLPRVLPPLVTLEAAMAQTPLTSLRQARPPALEPPSLLVRSSCRLPKAYTGPSAMRRSTADCFHERLFSPQPKNYFS